MLVLFIFLSTCVGLTIDMSLATQNQVFYEIVCCLYFSFVQLLLGLLIVTFLYQLLHFW